MYCICHLLGQFDSTLCEIDMETLMGGRYLPSIIGIVIGWYHRSTELLLDIERSRRWMLNSSGFLRFNQGRVALESFKVSSKIESHLLSQHPFRMYN
jgi:hypothetical protein